MYEVLVSPEADADLDQIIRYIAIDLRNPEAASALADKIDARLNDLETMPNKFAFCKDAVLRAMGYRRASVGNYLILYRVNEDSRQVLIAHYYHTLQDYEHDLLHFRG